MSARESLQKTPILWPIFGIVFLLLILAFLKPDFFSIRIQDGHLYGNLIDIFTQSSHVMLLAMGMTLVIAVGGVDLSVGSVMALAATTTMVLIEQAGVGLWLAIPVGLVAGTMIGAANGALVVFAKLQPIVATLVFMVAGRGIAQLASNSNVITVNNEAMKTWGNGHFLAIPISLWMVGLVFVVLYFLLRKTALGLLVEAVGDNERASQFCGIDSNRLRIIVYAFCGMLAGMAGLMRAASTVVADPNTMGLMLELDAIFAVIIGGTALTGGRFMLGGSILGVILLQTLTTTLIALDMPPAWAPAPKAVVIVAVCLMQSGAFRKEVFGLFRLRRAGL
ncbi:MAG: ABC transporter permease [Verrucomicrobiota bacterium]